jgi:hypothetical protein
LQAACPHQPGDALAAVMMTVADKLGMHPRRPVAALGSGVDCLDAAGERAVRELAPGWPGPVLVVGGTRDLQQRITRPKQTTQEWRDMADQVPEDRTLRQAPDADYRYIGIDTTDLDVAGTVQRIKGAIPEVYAG